MNIQALDHFYNLAVDQVYLAPAPFIISSLMRIPKFKEDSHNV